MFFLNMMSNSKEDGFLKLNIWKYRETDMFGSIESIRNECCENRRELKRNFTSFRLPRWPILKTLPATLLRPRPKLKLYLFQALLTISALSMYGGTTTAVTVSLCHSSFCVQFFKPHASTASLYAFRNVKSKSEELVLNKNRKQKTRMLKFHHPT